MIPRKKIHLLLCTLCILYDFGNGGPALSSANQNVTEKTTVNSTKSTNLDSQSGTTVQGGTLAENIESRSETISPYSTETFTVNSESSTRESYTISTENGIEISSDDSTIATTALSYETTELDNCRDTPSVEGLNITSTDTTLIVSWEPVTSSEECILEYRISWYFDNVSLDYYTASATESSYTISEITPCQSYNISIVAIGKNGESLPETAVGDTPNLIPGVVEDLTIANTTEYSIDFTWSAPFLNPTCVLFYKINICYENHCNESDSTTNLYYNATDLSPCQEYTITVTAVGDAGSSAETSKTAETSIDIPGVVEDLTIINATGYSVYFTWSAPLLNPTCVLSYKITVCYENQCNEIDSTTNLYYNATDLSPCQEYSFTVTAVGDAGSSAETSKTAETSIVTSTAPHSLMITPGQFSLFVSWEQPLIGSTCVDHYRVIWWREIGSTSSSDSSSGTTANTNMTLLNLSACMSYVIQIIAISRQMTDSLPATLTGATEESITNPPVQAIEPPNVTESTITISWSIDRTMNECELKNIYTGCNFISTNGRNISVVNGHSMDDISFLDSSPTATINITVNDLSPFSLYNCIGSIENVAGYSENSTVVTARTAEDVPSAPAMDVSSVESSEFTLIWDDPWYLPGNLIEYEISLSWEQFSLTPSSCVYNVLSTTQSINGIEGSQSEYHYTAAIPYSNYTAKTRVRTNAGWGVWSDIISFTTAPDVPGVVTNITYLNISNAENPIMLDALLFWQLPCSLNGEIEYFCINYTGIRNQYRNDVGSRVYHVNGSIDANEIFSINFGELKSEYRYTFEISAKVAEVSELGPSTTYNITYPAGLPPWPEEVYLNQIKMSSNNIDRTSSTSWILLPLFKPTNGEIKYYAIMISEMGQNFPAESRFDILSGSWPNSTSWREAMSRTPIVTYQATPIRWKPAATNNVEHYGHISAVKFNLGENESCSELSTRSYCNGPLEPDKLYQVRMRAFTNGGFRDSQVFIIRTKAEFDLGMVIGVVLGILFLGIITTMMLLIRKGVLQTVLSNILNRSTPGSPGPDPLPRKKFELHCQELIDNPGKLSNEFQLLQTLSVDLEMSATAAELQANRKKNRYINILPYDIARVKLEVINNDPNSDYINASLIQGYSGGTEYIACQGPKEETTYDFWRMIYEYNVRIIVMVTQLVEKGKDKCYQYYPNARESFTLEDFTIRCSTQLDFVFYTQRVITLQKEDTKRTVIHLHFKEWSDHGVPDDVHSMINFCQIIRKQINEYKSLAVVHCSAGVGRTGTLIAVDILLQQIKDNKKLDVFGTVYRMRQHRMNMVQTESQYAYIYDCTKQALNNPYPPKQYKTTSIEPAYENLTKKDRQITDSNTNLVASADTLKKVSPSASSGSLDPICELTVPQRPVYTSQLSTLSLRYSKSTSAIHSFSIPPNLEFARYGSHEYPIFEPAPDSPLNKVNMDMQRFLEFAKPIKIETRISPLEDDQNTDCTMHGFELNY